MSRLNVLVTGGKGFIGNRIIELMGKENNNFLILDLENGQDITDKKNLGKWIGDFQPQIIFHMAAILGTPETFHLPQEKVLAVNVLGTINMLEVARTYHARFIYPALLRIWYNPYCITKGCGEDYVKMYHKHYDVETVTLTLSNVYGPKQRTSPYEKIVPTFTMAALQGKPLLVSGTGNQTVDMIYIDDVAKAFILAAESSEAVGQQIEIGTGIEYMVNEVAEMILELTGSKSEIHHIPWRLGEDPESRIIIHTSKAEKLLAFKAEVALEEGLPPTIQYYRKLAHVL